MTEQYGLVDGYEDEGKDLQEVARWNEQAARSFASKLSIASGLEDENSSNRIVEELTQEGVSPTANTLKDEITNSNRASKMQEASALVQTEGVDVASQVLRTRLEDEEDLIDEEAAISFGSLVGSGEDAENFFNVLDQEKEYRKTLKREYADAMKFDGSVAGDVVEFFEGVIPFVEQKSAVMLLEAIEDEFGLDTGSPIGGVILEGDYLAKVRGIITEMPPQEQLEMFQFVNTKAKEVSGVLGENDFLRVSLLDSLFEGSLGSYVEGDVDTNKIINNAVSLLDATLIGQLISRAVSTVTRTGKVISSVAKASNAATAQRVSPRTGAAVTAEAILDPTNVKAMNLTATREDLIIDSLMHKWKDNLDITQVSDDFVSRQMNIMSTLVAKDRDISTYLTHAERVATKEMVESSLTKYRGLTQWKSASRVENTSDGVKVNAVFGRDEVQGFPLSDVPKAIDVMKNRYPQASVKAVARNYSGESVPSTSVTKVPKEAPEEVTKDLISRIEGDPNQIDNINALKNNSPQLLTGEVKSEYQSRTALKFKASLPGATKGGDEVKDFFVQVEFTDPYKLNSKVEFNMEDIYLKGAKAKFLGDVSSGLAQHLSNTFYRAFDLSKGTEKMFIDMLSPFLKTSNDNKKSIVRILDEGKMEERTYNTNEIIDKLPVDISEKNLQEILEGYYSVRIMADTSHAVLNKILREELEDGGMSWVSFGDAFNAFAKPISFDTTTSIKSAYDPKTGAVTVLSPSLRKNLYDEGGQILKSKQLNGSGTEFSQYIIAGRDVNINPLPTNVLAYREGYLPRTYKEQYFIRTKPKKIKIDGETLPPSRVPSKTIAVAKSKKQAQAIVDDMRASEGDTLDIDWKNSRELTRDARTSSELELEAHTGGLFFGRRGEHLKDPQNSLADTEDAVGSIYKMAVGVSKRVELDPAVSLMKKRWQNTFGDLVPEGKYPNARSIIQNPEKVRDERTEKAIAMWDYIDLAETSGLTSQHWRTHSVRFGEFLEDATGSDKLGSFFRTKVSERDPLSAARGATFISTIVLNPLRQLFIQSQQFLFLSGIDPKYVLGGGIHRQGTALLLGSSENTKLSSSALAKMAGMSVKEYDEAVDGFKKSGLTEAIDSHLIGKDALTRTQHEITNSKTQAVIQKGKNALSQSVGAIRSVGFDFGERVNISYTYMLARKRWKEAHPGKDIKSKEAEAFIAADTRQLALGMTQAGSFGYQRGLASLASQFFSVQHKAFLAMIRGVPGLSHYGNKAITPGEARRIMLFQLGLYGASGVGIHHVVDSLMQEAGVGDISDPAKQAIYGGVYDLMWNGIISGATGDEVDLSFSKNLSAGQGFSENLFAYISDLSSGDKSVLEVMSGPSANLFSKAGNVIKHLGIALGNPEQVDASDGKAILDSFGRIASQYNNYLKMRGMLNMGTWVDGNLGSIPVGVSDTEAVIAGLLGVQGYKQEAFYEYVKDVKSQKEDLKDIAKTYYDRITQHTGRYGETDDPVQLENLKRLLNHESHFIKASLGERDSEQVFSLVQDLIKQRGGNDENNFSRNLHRALLNNSLGSSYTDIVTNSARKGLINDEEATKLIEVGDKLYGDN